MNALVLAVLLTSLLPAFAEEKCQSEFDRAPPLIPATEDEDAARNMMPDPLGEMTRGPSHFPVFLFMEALGKGVSHPARSYRILHSSRSDLAEDSEYERALLEEPNPFRVLSHFYCRRWPSVKNNILVLNPDGYTNKDSSYCAGFAELDRKLLTLSFFAPGEPGSDDGAHTPDWTEKTKQKLKLLISGEAQIFEGVSNLEKLTATPEIQEFLRGEAGKLWEKDAVNIESLKSVSLQKQEERTRLLEKLREKLSRWEMPIIYVRSKGKISYTHTMPIYDLQKCEDGEERIVAWDVDNSALLQQRIPRVIRLLPDGRMIYSDWIKERFRTKSSKESARNPKMDTGDDLPPSNSFAWLSSIRLTPNDERDTLEIVRGLNAFCETHLDLCAEACNGNP